MPRFRWRLEAEELQAEGPFGMCLGPTPINVWGGTGALGVSEQPASQWSLSDTHSHSHALSSAACYWLVAFRVAWWTVLFGHSSWKAGSDGCKPLFQKSDLSLLPLDFQTWTLVGFGFSQPRHLVRTWCWWRNFLLGEAGSSDTFEGTPAFRKIGWRWVANRICAFWNEYKNFQSQEALCHHWGDKTPLASCNDYYFGTEKNWLPSGSSHFVLSWSHSTASMWHPGVKGIFETHLMGFPGIAVVTIWSAVFYRESGGIKPYKLFFNSLTNSDMFYLNFCLQEGRCAFLFQQPHWSIRQMELDLRAADFQDWLHSPAARLCQPCGEGAGPTSGGLTFSIRHTLAEAQEWSWLLMRKLMCQGKIVSTLCALKGGDVVLLAPW